MINRPKIRILFEKRKRGVYEFAACRGICPSRVAAVAGRTRGRTGLLGGKEGSRPRKGGRAGAERKVWSDGKEGKVGGFLRSCFEFLQKSFSLLDVSVFRVCFGRFFGPFRSCSSSDSPLSSSSQKQKCLKNSSQIIAR